MAITSLVPDVSYMTLSTFMLAVGLFITDFLFLRQNCNSAKELISKAMASIFLVLDYLLLSFYV